MCYIVGMKPTLVQCKVCLQQFVAKDPRKMYCSPYCLGRSRNIRNRKHFDSKPCEQCGVIFTPDRKNARFCSVKCHDIYGNANHALHTHICPNCGITFTSKTTRTKYCSHHCSLSHVVIKRTLLCVDCGTPFEFIGRTKKHRCEPCHRTYWNAYYASANAGVKGYKFREEHHSWKPDNKYRRLARSLPGEVRVKYRNICYDYWPCCCTICGALGKIDVHHIDGSRLNFEPTNLVPFCRTHHGEVHRLARKLGGKHPTPEHYKNATFTIWPLGPQSIGIIAQQCATAKSANSVNVLASNGRANAELGSSDPSVETIYGQPLVG